jgi:transposase
LNYLWFLDQVEPYVKEVHPTNPYKTRVIAEAKCKTDKYDSWVMAELLRINFLPESYYIPQAIRIIRELIRRREYLVRLRAGFKSKIRDLAFKEGVIIKVKDISSVKAKTEIARNYLSPSTRQAIAQYQDLISLFGEQIKPLEQRIESSCQGIKEIDLLMSIKGIGRLRAVIIYAEIIDINRFATRKRFASYAGLIPIFRESGDKHYGGGLTKTGSKPLRTALVETAIFAVRHYPGLQRLHSRVRFRSCPQKARIAVARKLAIIIYAMLKKNTPFNG